MGENGGSVRHETRAGWDAGSDSVTSSSMSRRSPARRWAGDGDRDLGAAEADAGRRQGQQDECGEQPERTARRLPAAGATRNTAPRRIRRGEVLAIDGGGIRGLIPALVLAEIERRTERRIADLVDTIAGTSTGGILACALGKPDPLPAAEIASLYVEEGPKIFDRSLLKQITSLGGYLDERYDSEGSCARSSATSATRR